MDVILDVLGGNSFSIEVGPFDTVLHVKEKVQKIHHIPVSYQTFVFHGEILPDDLQLSRSQLRRGYRINLLVTAPDFQNLAPPPPPLPLGTPEFPPSSHLNPLADYCDQLFGSSTQVMPMPSNRNVFQELMPPPMRMTLKVKVPTILDRIPIEMECEDTVRKLKEKILALDNLRGIPVERIALQSHSARVELLNHQVLQDCCSVLENNEIDAFSKTCSEKRMVNVKLPMSQNRIRIEVEVDDTFRKLKEKIVALEGMQGVPVERILLYPCSPIPQSVLNPIFYVYLKSSVPVAGGGSSSASSGKMTVYLKPNGLPKCYPLQVNAVDNVSALGQQLGLLLQNHPLRLPPNEVFFMVYKGEWMNEQESFEWHGIRDCTKIATFVGCVNDSITPIFRPNIR